MKSWSDEIVSSRVASGLRRSALIRDRGRLLILGVPILGFRVQGDGRAQARGVGESRGEDLGKSLQGLEGRIVQGTKKRVKADWSGLRRRPIVQAQVEILEDDAIIPADPPGGQWGGAFGASRAAAVE
jgi:hypothetical protein